jgi:hypothetical protein
LKRGETFAIFHKSGKLAELILRLNIFVRAGEIAVAATLTARGTCQVCADDHFLPGRLKKVGT